MWNALKTRKLGQILASAYLEINDWDCLTEKPVSRTVSFQTSNLFERVIYIFMGSSNSDVNRFSRILIESFGKFTVREFNKFSYKQVEFAWLLVFYFLFHSNLMCFCDKGL